MQLIAELYRPRDLLALSISAENLQLDTSDKKNPKLSRPKPNLPAYLLYEFQPQTIFEQAYFEGLPYQPPPGQPDDPCKTTSVQTPDAPGQVGARITHPTRLVFLVPTSVASIPFTVVDVVDGFQFDAHVVPVAQSTAQ